MYPRKWISVRGEGASFGDWGLRVVLEKLLFPRTRVIKDSLVVPINKSSGTFSWNSPEYKERDKKQLKYQGPVVQRLISLMSLLKVGSCCFKCMVILLIYFLNCR